jgi:WD40 repeat protein
MSSKAPMQKKILNSILRENAVYQFIAVSYAVIPVILIMSYRDITYGHVWFVFVDFALTLVYLFEYLLRQYVNDFRFHQALISKYELVVVAALCLHILVCMIVFSGYPKDNLAIVVTHVAVLFRTFRVVVAFPQLHIFIKSVLNSSSGFIPTLLNIVFIILIWGQVAVLSFQHEDFNFNNSFLNEHYHFKDIMTSCVTLTAMGTGNMWTEILSQLKDGRSFAWRIWVEIFFTSFYLIMFFLLRATAIIIIFKYSTYGGGVIGLATQQLRAFQSSWMKLFNPHSVDVPGLITFLRYLPPPLGCGKHSDFLSTVRFAKKVMLCMPTINEDDNENLFEEEDLPNDVRDMKLVDPKKSLFTFRQVLVAVHKKCMLGCQLSDEDAYLAGRFLHQSRLSLMKLRIGRLVLSKHERSKVDFAKNAERNLLILQRLDQKKFRELFIHIMNRYLSGVKKSIQSFGFRGFDSFLILCLSKAAKNEHRAALQQLKVRKALNNPLLNNDSLVKAYEAAKANELYVRHIFEKSKELSEKYVGKLWNIESMHEIARFKEKGTVSALLIDSHNNIYAGFSTGILKIWKCVTSQGDLSKESRFKVMQTITLDSWIRSLCISSDGLLLFVGVGHETIMFSTKGGNRRKMNFTEQRRFKDHSDTVNAILHYGRFLITASDDGYVYYYNLTTGIVANSYNIFSKIFCLTQFNIIDEGVPLDDVFCTDAIAVGSANGYVTVLPLPLLTGGDILNETQSMEAISLFGGNSPVSSVQVAWNYLYAGFADGTVKIWSILLKKNGGTARYPIRSINIVKMGVMAVHAGPVTAISQTGGHLFTASHDFSIIPWVKPEKLGARSEAEFSQKQESGLVFHNHAVVCMNANNYSVVSGDDCGQIIVAVPATYDQQFSDRNTKGNSKVEFAFLEYDFKSCFIPINGLTMEEETFLNVTNVSMKKTTIRCLYKKTNSFFVEMNPVMNLKNGSIQITKKLDSGRVIELLEFEPNRSAQFRIIFTPENEML